MPTDTPTTTPRDSGAPPMDLRYNSDGLLWDEAFQDNHNILGVLPLDYAVLFHAAPELLAALTTLERYVSTRFEVPLNEISSAVLDARAAIQKATGTP